MSHHIVARKAILALAVVMGAVPSAFGDVVGTGDVSPANPSTWTNSTDAYIGDASTGAVLVNDGSTLLTSNGYLGSNTGATGTVTVDGTGSTWIAGTLVVGVAGTGVLNIANGGQVNCPRVTLGNLTDGRGTVSVDGSGSILNSDDLRVGEGGTGTLTITNAGQVTANSVSIGSTSLLALNLGILNAGTITNAGRLSINRPNAHTLTSVITGAGTLTQAGTGTTTLSAYQGTGAINVQAGQLALGTTQGSAKTPSLTIAGTINAWTASVDIKDNLLVVQTDAGSKAAVYATLFNQVNSTASKGILSMVLTPATALAVVDNGLCTVPKTTMRGQTLDENSILVVQALKGDADLTGVVDFADLTALLQSYASPQAERTWDKGNFTNQAPFVDLTVVLKNYNETFGTYSVTPSIAGGTSAGGAMLGSGGSSAVPEPGSLTVLAMGAAGLLTKCRRKRTLAFERT